MLPWGNRWKIIKENQGFPWGSSTLRYRYVWLCSLHCMHVCLVWLLEVKKKKPCCTREKVISWCHFLSDVSNLYNLGPFLLKAHFLFYNDFFRSHQTHRWRCDLKWSTEVNITAKMATTRAANFEVYIGPSWRLYCMQCREKNSSFRIWNHSQKARVHK